MKTPIVTLLIVAVSLTLGALFGPKPHDPTFRVQGEPAIAATLDNWTWPTLPWVTPTPPTTSPQAHHRPHRMTVEQERIAMAEWQAHIQDWADDCAPLSDLPPVKWPDAATRGANFAQ